MISVCMATYNGQKYIKQQIVSILKQLSETDELIISDDNSLDNTKEVINEINDNRIKFYIHNRDFSKKKHQSGYYCSNNFSNAIEKASGDYIFLSDQDDNWCDNKVERILNELKTSDLCMSNFSIIDGSEKVITQKYFSKNPITKNWFINL